MPLRMRGDSFEQLVGRNLQCFAKLPGYVPSLANLAGHDVYAVDIDRRGKNMPVTIDDFAGTRRHNLAEHSLLFRHALEICSAGQVQLDQPADEHEAYQQDRRGDQAFARQRDAGTRAAFIGCRRGGHVRGGAYKKSGPRMTQMYADIERRTTNVELSTSNVE